MKTIDVLHRLERQLSERALPRAHSEWAGADVVISHKSSVQKSGAGFYPEPRYVVTDYSLEVSGLFKALRDAFYAESRLDGCSKIEFFGRLANAANRCLGHSGATTAHQVCAAVLHEAFAIYDEMEEGTFQFLPVAVGNEIADDYIDEAFRSGFIGIEATTIFFKSRGVKVDHWCGCCQTQKWL